MKFRVEKKAATAEPDLAAFAKVAPGARVLDLAGSSGKRSAPLAAAGARVFLLDLDAAALAAGSGPRVRGDARAIPFAAGVFDLVLFRAVVHHLSEPVDALREAARVAKPGGAVLLVDKAAPTDPAAQALRNAVERLRHRGHSWSYTEKELANLAAGARLEVEATSSWVETKDAAEWIASGTCRPPWDGVVKEYLRADLAKRGAAFGARNASGGRMTIEDRWTALLLRKREGRR